MTLEEFINRCKTKDIVVKPSIMYMIDTFGDVYQNRHNVLNESILNPVGYQLVVIPLDESTLPTPKQVESSTFWTNLNKQQPNHPFTINESRDK